MKNLIVCADDYAISPKVSLAIRNLLKLRKINATSAMTISKFWPEQAKYLHEYSASADLGLHITLTDFKPLTSMSKFAANDKLPALKKLLLWSMFGKLPLQEIKLEIKAQLDSYVAYMGQLPDYLDGHQHVHILPQIRNLIIEIYNEYYKNNNDKSGNIKQHYYIRSCSDNIFSIFRRRIGIFKSLFIHVLGLKLKKNA